MKIVFLNPNSRMTSLPKFPMGMSILSAVLKKNGYQDKDIVGVQTLEPGWRDEVKDADMVFIHVTTMTLKEAMSVVGVIKVVNYRQAMIIVGGPHATLKPESFFERQYPYQPDIVVRGEAEETVLDIVHHKENGIPALKDILGISYKATTPDGYTIVNNEERPRPTDLDAIPFPDRTLFKGAIFHSSPIHKSTDLLTGRSCIYNCLNCQPALRMIMGKYRRRSVANVIEEIKYLWKHDGVIHINFNDNSMTHSREWIEEFCKALAKERLNITWGCAVCEREIQDKQMLITMYKAGCTNIQFGVESGSQRVLDDILHKLVNLDHVRQVVQWCNEIGMGIHTWNMMAIPGETKEEAKATIDFIASLNINSASFHISSPNPFTGYEKVANERNWNRMKSYSDLDNLDRTPMILTEEYDEAFVKSMDLYLKNKFIEMGWGYIQDQHSVLVVNKMKNFQDDPVKFIGRKVLGFMSVKYRH